MVPTVTPGEMKNQIVLSSAGQEFKKTLESTWGVRDRFKQSRMGGLVKDINTTFRAEN